MRERDQFLVLECVTPRTDGCSAEHRGQHVSFAGDGAHLGIPGREPRYRGAVASTTPLPAPRPIRTFVVIVLAVALGIVAVSTFDYMLTPMGADLGFSFDAGAIATMVPAIGGLVVVFVAGELGDHLGKRRVIAAGAGAFTLGALLVTMAPNLGVVAAGRAVEGVGGLTTSIVAIALLADTYVTPRQRALAFGAGAAILPSVYVLAPPIGAAIAQYGNWRLTGAAWAVMGVAAAVAALVLLPPDSSATRSELTTPLVAGLVLAGITGASAALRMGYTPWAVAALGVAAAAAVVLVVLMRTIRAPGLDLSIPRTRRGVLVLLAILLADGMNLLFFTTLFLQAQYEAGIMAVALMMVPVGLAGVLGGVGGGLLMRRVGPLAATVAMMTGAALAPLLFLLIKPGVAAWVVLAMAAAFALFQAGSVGPLVALLMNLAPPGHEGAAAAHRRAFGSIGVALGTVLTGLLVFGTFQATLTDELVAQGLDPAVAYTTAGRVRAAGVAAEMGGGRAGPPPVVLVAMGERAPEAIASAQRSAYDMAALACTGTYALAVLLVGASAATRRRRPG